MNTDISTLANRPVIIGGGAAGLMTALHLAPEPVVLLSKAPLGAEASSLWAQGGLAAAMGDDDDPALHLADTIAAGAGLCDEAVASRIVRRGARGGRRSRTSWASRSTGGRTAAGGSASKPHTAGTGSSMPPATAPAARSCAR